jgi:hypothetical protein
MTARDLDGLPVDPPLHKMTIKDHIKGDVTFKRFHDGDLWYRTVTGFEFPVPVSEAGTATFHATDQAILFMRYIRKWMEVAVPKEESK